MGKGDTDPFLIPLHKPFWGKEEERAAVAAMRGGTGVGDLLYSEELSKKLRKVLNIKYVLPTGSGTASLELACASILEKVRKCLYQVLLFLHALMR